MTPKTNEQNQRIKDDRREQILFNALKLFARRGLAATKISDIAAVSGFSQGLVYHYFDSKESVYTELVRQATEVSSQGMLALEQLPLEPLEKLKTIAAAVIQGIDLVEKNAYYFLLMTQALVSEANPEEVKALLKFPTIPFEVLTRIITEGQQHGAFQDDSPDDLAKAFWSMIEGLALCKVAYGDSFSIPDPGTLVRMFQK